MIASPETPPFGPSPGSSAVLNALHGISGHAQSADCPWFPSPDGRHTSMARKGISIPLVTRHNGPLTCREEPLLEASPYLAATDTEILTLAEADGRGSAGAWAAPGAASIASSQAATSRRLRSLGVIVWIARPGVSEINSNFMPLH